MFISFELVSGGRMAINADRVLNIQENEADPKTTVVVFDEGDDNGEPNFIRVVGSFDYTLIRLNGKGQ